MLTIRSFLVALVLTMTLNAQGQLRKVYVDIANIDNDIQKVSFFNSSQGYVASTGYPDDWIGYTSDSGHTITRRPITSGNVNYNGYPVNLTFGFTVSGVQAFSQDTVLAYGDYGLVPAILYSTDGGSTFKLVFHSQYNSLQLSTGIMDMTFPNNGSTGFAVDADRILRSTDRGKTWSVIATTPGYKYTYVESPDAVTIFAFNQQYGLSRLMRSTNGGTSWAAMTIPNYNSQSSLNYVHFISGQKGWLSLYDASGHGLVYYTSNGALSWSLQNNGDITPFAGGKFKFANDSMGYALYGYDVYKTTDSGKIWQPVPRDNNFSYLGYGNNDLQCASSQQFWAAGARDMIQLSTNGGGSILPKAFFSYDTLGVLASGTVKLFSYSKRYYNHRWLVNGTQVSTLNNPVYSHNVARASDTVRLIVSYGGSSDTLDRIIYFYVPPMPFISGFTPTSGSTSTRVRITGTNFSTVSAVRFGGTPAASFTVISDSRIDAIVGAGATGSVTLVNPAGTITMPGFTYLAAPVAAAPAINSFAPVRGPAGTTVTITGANFNGSAAGNFVYFGGMRATVTAASTTQITCQAPAGAEYAPITVVHSGNGLSATSNLPFSVTFSDSTNFTTNNFNYAYGIPYSYPLGCKGAAAGDVDGDGKPDLLTFRRNMGAYDSLVIYRNLSTGGNFDFAAGVSVGGLWPSSFGTMYLRDMDGDGRLDLVVPTNVDSVVVLRNTSSPGLISFAPSLSLTTSEGCNTTATADLDGDGRPDLAVACYNNRQISVLRNTGTPGNISFSANTDYTVAGYTKDLVAADFDGDGKKDLLAISANNTNTGFSVFRNQSTIGAISFAPRLDIPLVPGWLIAFRAIRAADFDGDGKMDIVMISNDSVNVLRNTSAGPGSFSFLAGPAQKITGGTNGIAVDNFSGDGRPDVAIPNWSFRSVDLLRNSSATPATLLDPLVPVSAPYPYATLPYEVCAADFNLDGKVDYAVASTEQLLSVFRNDLGIVFSADICTNGYAQLVSDLGGSSYQWQCDNGSGYMDLSNSSNVTGATTGTLTISRYPASWGTAKFRCVVNNSLYTTPRKFNQLTYPTPLVSVTTSSNPACAGANVTFSATGSNWGANPFLQWFVNGNYTGPNSGSWNTSGLTNGDRVQFRVTNNDSSRCTSYSWDTSLAIRMTINPNVQAAMTISGNTSLAVGGSSAITSALVNAGNAPQYQWQDSTSALGWQNKAGATAATYTYTPTANGAKLRCRLTSDATCVAPATVYSNTLTFSVGAATAVSNISAGEYGISWYPVPAQTHLFVNGLHLQDKWQTMTLLASDGRVVEVRRIESLRSITIPVSLLPAGQYLVRLQGKNGTAGFTFIH
ncbi:hypothetical protein EPD60_11175 [Flaviaesturariibacter flavus]|uniref:IPT/TIG domain-containing protein n=1 Tax=Flaviaesturariibacter flavus TaxID=2502780 RepID=A0A4R1BC71_9BACT|nr:FG-GAP-like repeat-containing protein [Flaviaesturariibacter flavus]TCJ14538.1 hypothetical protein EPD60_11175 [Flaviaesturariibacter flavus]